MKLRSSARRETPGCLALTAMPRDGRSETLRLLLRINGGAPFAARYLASAHIALTISTVRSASIWPPSGPTVLLCTIAL